MVIHSSFVADWVSAGYCPHGYCLHCPMMPYPPAPLRGAVRPKIDHTYLCSDNQKGVRAQIGDIS